MTRPLVASTPLLEAVPAIDFSNCKILDPGMYASWAAMLSANPNKADYLLTDGDYTSWGRITITSKNGTPERRRTFRYYHPSDSGLTAASAYARNLTHEALIDGIYMNHINDRATWWAFVGLTAREPTQSWNISKLCDGILFDRCMIDGVGDSNYGIRVWASNCTIQRSFITGGPNTNLLNSIGVQLKPLDQNPTIGFKFIDSEVKDVGDCFICTDDAVNPWVDQQFHLENLDLWSSLARSDGTAPNENAIDIKGASDIYQSIIRKVRAHGFRRNGVSAAGDCFVFHQHARNILVDDCDLSNAPSGIREEVFPAGEPQRGRNIVVQNTRFHEIKKYHANDRGAAVSAAGNMVVEDCTVTRSGALIGVPPQGGYFAGGPSFRDNTLIQVDSVYQPGYPVQFPVTEDENNEQTAGNGLFETYERYWFTGPEEVVGALEGEVPPPDPGDGEEPPVFVAPVAVRTKTKHRTLLEILVKPMNDIERALWALYVEMRIDTAIGQQLDWLGAKVGQRRSGEADEDFRRLVRARILVNRSSGRPADIYGVTRFLLDEPTASLRLETQAPASSVLHVEGLAFDDALGELMLTFLRDTRAAGTRLILESTTHDDAEMLVLPPSSTTSGSLSVGATTIGLADGSTFPSSGSVTLQQGSTTETKAYTGRAGNTLTGVTALANGYTAGALVLSMQSGLGLGDSSNAATGGRLARAQE